MQLAESFKQVRQRPIEVISQFWAWFFLLILLIFFSVTGSGFFSFFNLQSIGANAAIALIMALGQTFVIISGGIDLSTGFVMGLASVVAAQVMSALGTLSLPLVVILATLAGSLTGIVVGCVNGFIIGRLRVPPFIVTLGMLGIAEGAGFLRSGGLPVSVQINNLGDLGNGNLLYFDTSAGISFFHPPTGATVDTLTPLLPYPLLLVIVLVLICHWLLKHTRFGQHTYAIGGNQEAALRAGIPVVRHTIAVYALSALLASIAGILYVLRFTNGAANAGDASLLPSIAAVVIGGASLFGGEGTIVGTLIGALIIAVITNGLVILGINGYWQFVAVGIVIILAVLVDQAKSRIAQ